MTRKLIFLLILTSCSSYKSYNLNSRKFSSVDPTNNCLNAVLEFSGKIPDLSTVKYEKYNIFQNQLNFIKEERRLESQRENWMSIGQRSISVEQMRHHGAYSKIARSFEIDTPYIISKNFESLFKQIETSYFVAKKMIKKGNLAQTIKAKLSDDVLEKELSEELKQYIDQLNDDLIIDTKIISKESPLSAKESLDNYIEQVNSTIIEESLRIVNSFEQYKVTREFLDKKLQIPADVEKAKTILEKLETSKLLASCSICFEGNTTLNRPHLQEIENLLKEVKIARIIYLKRQLWSERLMSISSRLPNNALYYLVDIILQKTPRLNKSAFRKFLRAKVIDFRDVTKHFPNIDRVIFSKADTQNLVKLVNEISAQNNDIDFLITFARRVDAHDKWNQIINQLRANIPNEPGHQLTLLLSNMEKAWIEANNRGPLPEWHAPEKSNAIRFVIDTIFLGIVTYTGVDSIDGGIESVEDITGIDLIKQEEILEIVDTESQKLLKAIEEGYDASDEIQPEVMPEIKNESINSNKNLFEM